MTFQEIPEGAHMIALSMEDVPAVLAVIPRGRRPDRVFVRHGKQVFVLNVNPNEEGGITWSVDDPDMAAKIQEHADKEGMEG